VGYVCSQQRGGSRDGIAFLQKLYLLPAFLNGIVSQDVYERWLRRRAAACVNRDRKRLSYPITGLAYRTLIHAAVCRSGGADHYTGEALDWGLLSKYDNEESRIGRATYKAKFALLPSVDHVLVEDGRFDFVVCGWRTNNAKADLSHKEFVALCCMVVGHFESVFT
jgi:hypothetical protein